MPELPEVETTRRGIAPAIEGQYIAAMVVRDARLRWPIPTELPTRLANQCIKEVSRRAKYLLLHCDTGTLLIHLGMSGHLNVVPPNTPLRKHDHVDIVLQNQIALRYHDPRRFGSILWAPPPVAEHKLLAHLGPEPLDASFDGAYLYQRSKKCRSAVKVFIMNAQVVVGVGNIYANEALFMARIHPKRPANQVSLARYRTLVAAIKAVLQKAIKFGGTRLRDFQQPDGKPGYFAQELAVYGRGGEACTHCKQILQQCVIGQRATVFCEACQA